MAVRNKYEDDQMCIRDSVKVHGQDIQEQDLIQLRRHMGYVIQGSVLFPHLTVKQNIAYVLHLENKTKNMDQIVDQWLETVQLLSLIHI